MSDISTSEQIFNMRITNDKYSQPNQISIFTRTNKFIVYISGQKQSPTIYVVDIMHSIDI